MDRGPSTKIQAALASDIRRYESQGIVTESLKLLELNLFKKLEPDDTSDQDDAAFELFQTINRRNTEVVPEPRADVLRHVQECFRFLEHDYGSDASHFRFSDERLMAVSRFGPGASRGVKGVSHCQKAGTNALTFRSGYALAIYKASTLLSTISRIGEEHRQASYGAERIQASSMTFVPKDRRISRTICTEPSVDMYLQKGIGKLIEGALLTRFGIDLSYQPEINKSLAKAGSISGEYSTIDLKSASDTISLKVFDLITEQAPMFRALILEARTPKTVCRGNEYELHMVSTMGNGFTFPLQTYLFASILSFYSPDFVPVFGDDIVCRTADFRDVCLALESFGFVVNREKSFSEGLFRESCGGDYYQGRDVRAVYCKRLRTTRDFFVLWNRLQNWCLREKLYLWRTFECILGMIPKRERFPVPSFVDDSFGLKNFQPKRPVKVSKKDRERYGLPTVCWKYNCIVPKPVLLTRGRYSRYGHLATWLEAMLLGNPSDCISVRTKRTKDVYSSGLTTVWNTSGEDHWLVVNNEMLLSFPDV